MKEEAKTSLPVIVTVYDSTCREIQFGPVWLDIREPEESKDHWDRICKLEIEAKKILVADMECRIDWDKLTKR